MTQVEECLLGTPKYLEYANVLESADETNSTQQTTPQQVDYQVYDGNIDEYRKYNTTNYTGYNGELLNANNLGLKFPLATLRNPFNLESSNIDNPIDNPTTIHYITNENASLSLKRYENVEMAEDIPTRTQEELITPGYINQMFNATSMIPIMTLERIIQNEPIELFEEGVDTTGECKGSVPLWDFWDEK